MKKINLCDIAIKHMFSGEITERVLNAMKEACNEAIELCAENAISIPNGWTHDEVYKKSILDTKNQIV